MTVKPQESKSEQEFLVFNKNFADESVARKLRAAGKKYGLLKESKGVPGAITFHFYDPAPWTDADGNKHAADSLAKTRFALTEQGWVHVGSNETRKKVEDGKFGKMISLTSENVKGYQKQTEELLQEIREGKRFPEKYDIVYPTAAQTSRFYLYPRSDLGPPSGSPTPFFERSSPIFSAPYTPVSPTEADASEEQGEFAPTSKPRLG